EYAIKTDNNNNNSTQSNRQRKKSVYLEDLENLNVDDITLQKKRRYNHIVKDYSILSDIDYYVNNLLSEIKLMTLAIIDKDKESVEEHLDYIENEYLINFDELYIPLLKDYSNMEASKNPIISYGGNESELIYLNGFELVKKIEYYGYQIVGTSYEEWVQKVDNGEDLLKNDVLRFIIIIH
ncbi:hypothetical protein PIROE2DRAFT_62763, partial [Piromyces sp. E2]